MGAREYLDELRAAVGKRLLIVAGACVIVRDNAGRVLLHRRRDDGSWDVIGGSMEPGETFEQTVRREAREEIGVELGALEVLEIYSGPDFFHMYPNGDQVYPSELRFRREMYAANLQPDKDAVDEVDFFPLNALPIPLKDSARHHLEELHRREVTG